ncbi:AraC family transcriptional regulator [Parabacteroides sp. An277]|uniref:helix-turn-helix transcriptional regulator n=1 Tax=Parabacteroides sp. An277 TaxID=1965619 RepID=UPI000B3678E1|nr:helix-turn-helix transcriptional regulator [Parabacteroides sp. An277]OUO54113.1 AraC family transcriptional regulator [Parabacteroides sp. An277]
MIELPIIEFERLKQLLPGSTSFQNDLLLADLDADFTYTSGLIRTNALQVLLLRKGSLKINIDYKAYAIQPDTMVVIMPTHIVQIQEISSDFKGRLLIISHSFLQQTMHPGNSSPTIKYMTIRKNPCVKLLPRETEVLYDNLAVLRAKMGLRHHNLHRALLQNVILGFFIEIGNIFYDRKEFATPPALTRKEELFESFLKLLYTHCREQHVVSFYADHLLITPQYLSLVLKELSGQSANKWIDDALLQESKLLLKAPQASIQEVADALHFSDQSTFGKFFKRRTGMSPMEYRKSPN